MTKYIYVKGVHFENKGAELMLDAVVQQVFEKESEYKLVLNPCPASPYEKRAAKRAFQYLSLSRGVIDLNALSYFLPRGLRGFIGRYFGVVTEADLYAVLDASGYAYGDKWPTHVLKRTCKQIGRLNNHSKRYVFLPQAFGPFVDKTNINLVQRYFPSASLVFARDEVSHSVLSRLMSPKKFLEQSPDFTNLVDVARAPKRDLMLIIPNSNMLSKRVDDELWAECYVGLLENAISFGLSKGMEVGILNHEGKSDQFLCEQLKARFGSNVWLRSGLSGMEIKGLIAQAQLVMCSRFHGCVSALSLGVPCVGTSWSHKYQALYSDYNVSELLLVSPKEESDFQLFLNDTFESRGEISKVLKLNSEKLKVQSKRMWDRVRAVLNAQ